MSQTLKITWINASLQKGRSAPPGEEKGGGRLKGKEKGARKRANHRLTDQDTTRPAKSGGGKGEAKKIMEVKVAR